MAQHGVDGAFLQRLACQCDTRADNSGIRRIRDEVGDRVREAAEKNNRVYAIMYVSSPVFPNYPRGLILCEVRRVWSATRKDRGDYQIRLETPRIRQTHFRQSELSKREGKARCRVVGYSRFFSFTLLYRVTADTNHGAVLPRLWLRGLSPHARSCSLNRFLHKQLPPRRCISDGRRSVSCGARTKRCF